ncbi:hypothetical protein K2173_016945 [Erythroxylum novogranatense]|uniref:AT-hook motif nuclear-localized protein n=1 Tax=Erythroxylum novogranatense TaxID=1862640 RepID=A0AAV8U8J2_9ROSI|nr:hypothetical protein K2173_016945 [Erythroxylum novogranatense]
MIKIYTFFKIQIISLRNKGTSQFAGSSSPLSRSLLDHDFFYSQDTLVHSSNCLAIKALKDDKKHLVFVKSCIAFGKVTIRSISSEARQLSLYLETTEVALMGGLVSHSDGLIVATLSCLESVDLRDGPQAPIVLDGMLSSICKLCGLVVMVPDYWIS